MNARYVVVPTACLCLIILQACSTSVLPPSAPAQQLAGIGPAASPAPAATLPLSTALPALSRLDELVAPAQPALRQSSASIDTNFEIYPEFRLANSANVVFGPGGEATMVAAAGQLEWLLFEAFNAGSECEDISLDADLLKGEIWLAVADFSLGRWRIMGPFGPGDPQISVHLDEADYYSPLHRQYVAVLVSNGGQLILRLLHNYVENPEPLISEIEPSCSTGLEFIETGGLPGVSYIDNDGHMIFALAKDDEPAGLSDWRRSHIDDVNGGNLQSLTLHKGRPVLLYSNFIDNTLHIAAAKTATPLLDSDWEHKQVVPDANCLYCSLCSDGEHLYLAYYENDDADLEGDFIYGYLGFGRSATDDPLGSYSYYRVSVLGDNVGSVWAAPSIALVNGRPAIAIIDSKAGLSDNVRYFYSNADAPILSDWKNYEMASLPGAPYVVLQEQNGRPALCWNSSQLQLSLGLQADPLSSADWSTVNATGQTVQDSFAMQVRYGRFDVAAVFEDAGDYSLGFGSFSPRSFIRDNGAVDEVFFFASSSVPLLGDAQVRAAVVNGRPAVAYYDSGDSSLNYVQIVND